MDAHKHVYAEPLHSKRTKTNEITTPCIPQVKTWSGGNHSACDSYRRSRFHRKSVIADALTTRGIKVTVFDNLTVGTQQNLKHLHDNPNLNLTMGDLLNPNHLQKQKETTSAQSFTWQQTQRSESAQPDIHFQNT